MEVSRSSPGTRDHPELPENLQCLEFLGAGGQGEVWLAKDSMLDRKVVCKRLDQRFATRENWRSTLVALADAALKSRTIPQLFGVQTVGDSCWLIQEFVQGTTLEMAHQDRPTRLGDRSILLVAMDLLAAAVAFRAVGLVHGDINPANVLIDGTGRARVIDFNCAALIGEKLLGVGVPGFRRPDAGPPPSADPLDDAFAIGCLIFWLLGLPLPNSVRGLEGQLLVSAAPCPKSPSRLEDLLWRTARDLTAGVSAGTGSLEEHLARLRNEARLLPTDARDDLVERQTSGSGGIAPLMPWAPRSSGTPREPQTVRGHGKQQQISAAIAPSGELPVGQRKPLLMLALVLGLVALVAALPWRSTPPTVIAAPAYIAANTALPPSFSMDWLASELRQALSVANAGALPQNEVLHLSLHCGHRACTLVLHPSMNPGGGRYELQFVASHERGVWETAITELAQVVATP